MPARRDSLDSLLGERILVLDGAMGTLIRQLPLGEAEYRGERFRRHGRNLQDNYDLLTLTRPEVVSSLHHEYLEAGSDVIRTNTFGSSSISQAAYGLGSIVGELNTEAARLAGDAARAWTARTPHKPRFVAGTIGPARQARGERREAGEQVAFEELRDAYCEQIVGLRDGGCDAILVETICDTRSALAALDALARAGAGDLPVMLSVTTTERDARLPSGETLAAFATMVEPGRPFALGVNCAFGARQIGAAVAELARQTRARVSCHPSAGLPDAGGRYEESPDTTAACLRELAERGLVNLVGGCCGTTPAHIRAIAGAVAGLGPRREVAAPGF